MKRVTDFKIKIGDKLDYVEYGSFIREPVTVTNIFFDGFVFLIELKDERATAIAVTQYPDKLKQRL